LINATVLRECHGAPKEQMVVRSSIVLQMPGFVDNVFGAKF